MFRKKEIPKFDYIYTNPPWGKKMDKETKLKITKNIDFSENSDTYVLFLLACLKKLKADGKLGFLLPESFFNISVYEEIRKRVLQYSIERLKNYGKVFKGLQTQAVGIILKNNEFKENKNHLVICESENKKSSIHQKSFQKMPKYIFNINCDQEERKVIEYLFSIEHITLKNNAQWALGIVTGNNAKFVKNIGDTPVYKGADITKNGLKNASSFINLNDWKMYQQVAPLSFFQAKEKLIYKFISSDLCFYYDTGENFVLNSANILITNQNFPISMKTLAAIFNSDFMNWFFQKIFNTHKILRGDLELLPIYSQFLSENFDEDMYLSNLNIIKENGTYRLKKQDYSIF